MVREEIRNLIQEALDKLQIVETDFTVEHPSRIEFGDYSTNVGIKTGKAEEITVALRRIQQAHREQAQGDFISEIKIKSGFINFFLSKEFFAKSLEAIIEEGVDFGKGEKLRGEKVMVEHTDPNPFKEFHIGHLMPNVIGSTLARIYEWNGAEVKQANYQGDKGVHVACAVWALLKDPQQELTPQSLGIAYARGAGAYNENEDAKKEIDSLNKVIYEESDGEVMEVYEKGRRVSLEYFESIYKKLNAKFDYYFFESETAKAGKKIVEDNLGKVFEESEGAVVFKGEKYDPSLHTRVFVNSLGLPTYEAKDLGNAKLKFDKYPYTKSIIVTGSEIKDYFRVVLKALELIYPELAAKTRNIPHGMLRLPTGKMSSRTGQVITAEWLIGEVKRVIEANGQNAKDEIAVSAIKYMILKQAIGGDIIFDFEKSISTEGDSGPYLQYAYARTNSLLEKAKSQGLALSTDSDALALNPAGEVRMVEKLLYRFPEVVEQALDEFAPHRITTYLTELSSAFNNFYAHEQVIPPPDRRADSDHSESAYRLAIVESFNIVMKNGLNVLGIPTPDRM